MLDYLVKNGSQRVVQQCKDNMFSIETLKDFQFVDKEAKDQGTLSGFTTQSVFSLSFYVNFCLFSTRKGEESSSSSKR